MPRSIDGPSTPLFVPVPLVGNMALESIPSWIASPELLAASGQAPRGDCVCWGIRFSLSTPVVLTDSPVEIPAPCAGRWLVFLHTADIRPGYEQPSRGPARLGERAADYVVLYEDGTEERLPILRRRQIGPFTRRWGENCFEAVAHTKPRALRGHHEQANAVWGRSQTRVDAADGAPWIWWLWAWENPRESRIRGFRFEPVSGTTIVGALSAGNASSHPVRWIARRKALVRLSEDLDGRLDDEGQLVQLRLDLGQVVSATPQAVYPADGWEQSYGSQVPSLDRRRVLVEYSCHEQARFHFANGEAVAVASLEARKPRERIDPVPPATRRVTLRVVEASGGEPVPVKLHVHGQAGEYLAPVDRHRIPNAAWFEDYSVDFVHAGAHLCTYISGETTIDLPLGAVYVELSKGYEIRPIRKRFTIGPETERLEIRLDRVLPWRERGWVTADTHVHFLSPPSALLEGSAEGVNVVNLLASQWGELMTNVGDFDGKTTWGSREAGGDGEYLVRVGTENRQHVLGHISLLGYGGRIIAPMTTGGPDESALGDPVEILLTEWARQCRSQGGLVVLPHFPNPRAEHAAALVSGDVDGVEMTSWGNLYGGIDPYSLADWYRYLNCGYRVAAVGGTDKMSANTAVGTVRTYARIADGRPFDYGSWMEAVRRAETFVTYGPLMDVRVNGQPLGSRVALPAGGGTVDVTWEVASVTVPVSRVELVVGGEIRESVAAGPERGAGSFSVRLGGSSWIALLVRGHYADKPEIVAAHSSPVMVEVAGSPFAARADALTILEQIEGALAYLDTVGTRADTEAYKRMRLVLQGAHRSLHNRMHASGHFHEHTPTKDHPEHRRT